MENSGIGDQIVFLYCADLGKTAYFYEEILGLELVLDQGSCRIVKVARNGGGYLGYCEKPGWESADAGLIVTFVVPAVDEVNAWYMDLAEKGIEVHEPPKWNPEYGIYHFFFNDPEGYKLEIQCFENQNWSSPV